MAEEIGNTQEQAPPGPDSGSEPDLAQEFETLWQQVAALRYRWQTLMELYGKGQDRLDLLNRTAPTFFGLTRNLLTLLRHEEVSCGRAARRCGA